MIKRRLPQLEWTTLGILMLQFSGLSFAQSLSQAHQWPDNIIIAKRLMGDGKVDEGQMSRGESSAVAVCALLGKLYEPGTLRKVMGESDIVTGETTYLSGRRKLVITESLMKADEKGEACISRYRLGWTYQYTGPGEAWTVVNSPKGIYSPKRPASNDPKVVGVLENAYQNRVRNFGGKWRGRKYSEVETRFGHRCGYPPDPAALERPAGMGEYGALYDKAVAAAQQFHQEGPKLCQLIESPEHVGTGEKLVLHFRDSKRNFDERTGCYDFNESGSYLKRKCIPIVVDFQINAAMPPGIFQKPQWANGAGIAPVGGNPAPSSTAPGFGVTEGPK